MEENSLDSKSEHQKNRRQKLKYLMFIWLETQNEREVYTVEENVFKQIMVANFPTLKTDRHPDSEAQ